MGRGDAVDAYKSSSRLLVPVALRGYMIDASDETEA